MTTALQEKGYPLAKWQQELTEALSQRHRNPEVMDILEAKKQKGGPIHLRTRCL